MASSTRFKANLKKLAIIDPQRNSELHKIENGAIAQFKGQAKELESAVGMLRLGDHLGWRALVIIHNKRTIRKYENILGIEIREFFPEEGPSAQRSMGYVFAQKLGNFWKAVSGDLKVENRHEIS